MGIDLFEEDGFEILLDFCPKLPCLRVLVVVLDGSPDRDHIPLPIFLSLHLFREPVLNARMRENCPPSSESEEEEPREESELSASSLRFLASLAW